MICFFRRNAARMAAVSALATSGESRGIAERCSGLLPPPSRKLPVLDTASITARGPTIQVQRHPG